MLTYSLRMESTSGRFGKEESLEESIKIMHDIKRKYTVEDVKERAVRAIKESVKFGVTKIRGQRNDAHAKKVIELLKLADFNVCVNPQVLAIMGIDPEPRTRGVTRVRELVEAGVNVATAQDTICDGFHIFGTGDPLDYGLLMAYVAQYNSTDKVGIIFDMITKNFAKIMRLKDYGIKEGNTADFNIIFAKSEQEALRTRPGRLVFKKGKLIARIEKKEEIL